MGNESLKLRQNQRLNARIEFEKKDNVLMVKKGPFIQSTAGTSAFVVSGEGQASRRDIATGSLSVDFVELVNGAQEGDEFIISSYEAFNHTDTIRIKQ